MDSALLSMQTWPGRFVVCSRLEVFCSAASSEFIMPPDSDTLLNISGYRLDKRIGEGGMARVYLAIQESLNRPVALKVLSSDFSTLPEFSKRFLNEGRILASLRHTNIITIYDFGIDKDVHYICMEYVDGEDLKTRIRAGVKPSTALDYIETLADCLGVAHSRNIVHRDIKPANVLFRDDDTLLLTDFGIAKQLDETSDLTTTGSTLGSPHYLSPEQARSRPVDRRADIYSLGIMLYEMIVRQKPYRGDSEINTALKHITEPIPVLPVHLQAFQPLLEKMLAKEPSDRFNDVTELIDAVRAIRSDEQELLSELDALTVRSSSSAAPAATTAIAASADSVFEASGLTLAMTGEDEINTDVRATRDRPTIAAPPTSSDKDDRLANTLALDGEKKAHSFRLLGSAVVLSVSVLVGVGLWATRSADMPAGMPGVEKLADPEKQLTSSAQLPPTNVSTSAEPTTLEPQTLATMPSKPISAEETPARIDRDEEIAGLLEQARIAIKAFRLTKPEGNNALAFFQQILDIDPNNAQAQAGPAAIAQRYSDLARSQLARQRYSKANEYIDKGLELDPKNPQLLALKVEARPSKPSAPRQQGRREDTPEELFNRVKKFFD